MGYKVIYSDAARKYIERLDRPLQKRILTFVDKIEASVDPRFSGKALRGNKREWRYRIGFVVVLAFLQSLNIQQRLGGVPVKHTR